MFSLLVPYTFSCQMTYWLFSYANSITSYKQKCNCQNYPERPVYNLLMLSALFVWPSRSAACFQNSTIVLSIVLSGDMSQGIYLEKNTTALFLSSEWNHLYSLNVYSDQVLQCYSIMLVTIQQVASRLAEWSASRSRTVWAGWLTSRISP